MNKIAHYLQEHLLGEVTASPEVRQHFAHDASVLQLAPAVVVYPRDENDVRKSVRFAWQLAERGRPLSVTARGYGSGTAGAAIGNGLVMVFTAHMNKIVQLNSKKRTAILQPGISYEVLQKVLHSHQLFLPPYPANSANASIGAGIATNAIGEKSVKYGSTAGFVQSLRVVLSNGEVIETGSLNKKELSHKLGLQTLEGSIYRSLDTLLEENGEFIRRGREKIRVAHNVGGYNLFDIKKNDNFNLTPLIFGSEGTLGIITEASFNLAPLPLKTLWVLISLDDLGDMYEVLPRLLELKPSVVDFINRPAIEEVLAINPNQLNGVLSRARAAIHLFVEFDDAKAADQKKALKQLEKVVEKAGGWLEIYEGIEAKERLLKLHESVSTILSFSQGKQRPVPVAEDISVPVDRLVEFLHKVEAVYREVGLPPIAWGHAGSGVVRSQPLLNLSQTGDRQKLFKIQGGLYNAAVELGGSTSASAGDGRVRAPYISLVYGNELYELMLKVKKIFDPHGILNPGVKTASPDEIKTLMRTSYDVSRFAEHLPRS